MNATLEKFGYPHRVILETAHWAAVLRPAQATLGALVLAHKSRVTAFSDLPQDAFTDLHGVCQSLETALKQAFAYDKINYLMLMMVDPEVHFHVLPRYARTPDFLHQSFEDPGWPGPPDLTLNPELNDSAADQIVTEIRRHLP